MLYFLCLMMNRFYLISLFYSLFVLLNKRFRYNILTAACRLPSCRSAASHSNARLASYSTYSAVIVLDASANLPIALAVISITPMSADGIKLRRIFANRIATLLVVWPMSMPIRLTTMHSRGDRLFSNQYLYSLHKPRKQTHQSDFYQTTK